MKDWRIDMHNYPRQETILTAAKTVIVGEARVAAGVLAEEYRNEFKHLAGDERQPCIDCPSLAIYFCYLSGMECRKWVKWLESWAR